MKDAALILRSTLAIYGECLVKSGRGLIVNWSVLVAAILLCVAYFACGTLVAPFGMAGGFIMGMVSIALLSYYYAWVGETIDADRLSFRTLWHFDAGLFFNLLSVAFIFFIVRLLIGPFSSTLDTVWVGVCVNLTIVVLFNALPEVIHSEREDGLVAIQRSFEFVRENWIEWYAPFLVMVLPWLAISPSEVLTSLAGTPPLLPPLFVVSEALSVSGVLGGYITVGLGIIVAHWFMLFRGHLYLALKNGTRRQRIYRARQES